MKNFRKQLYKLQSASCSLNPLTIITTDPTNLPANNGTATITYSGGQGQIAYSLNGGSFINVSSSPFTIIGLLASTSYTVIVKDDIDAGCQQVGNFTLGETSFVFDADYIMMTYQFTNGQDLDTRTRIVSPNVGQTTQNTYLGWGVRTIHPMTGTPYETWSGDNTGTGYESVLINMRQFLIANPTSTEIVVDMRGFWYSTVGTLPVSIGATLWKGGTPLKTGFIWINPTADSELLINSTGKIVTRFSKLSSESGERIATFTYNILTKEGVLNNNDTTTPSI